MARVTGAPPQSGWARMVTELHVTDLGISLSFWADVLGFEVAFERPEERFSYLEHPEGHQIMLCQRHGRFETGPLEFPLGQGALFQITFTDIQPVLERLAERNWPIYLGERDAWRRTGQHESGRREVCFQDPDGYLIMVAASLGQRPIQG